MTREEAIKIIDCYDIGFYDLSGAKIPADKLADAFDMAIEALQDEAPKPTGELIARADAIEAVMAEGRKVYTSEYANAERVIYEADAVEALSMLPSAEAVEVKAEQLPPKVPTEWINDGMVLVPQHDWIEMQKELEGYASAEAPTIDAKGVLVKGMEMPKNCVVCKFGDAPEFERFCIVQGYKHLGEWDKTTDRPSDCPLVEITSQAQKEISDEAVTHGRLIDADALPQDRILHIGTEFKDGKVNIVAEWQGELVRCKDCRYCTEYYDREGYPYWICDEWDSGTDADGFCHYGKRKGGDDE